MGCARALGQGEALLTDLHNVAAIERDNVAGDDPEDA